jgi:signal transduction histidine kinase
MPVPEPSQQAMLILGIQRNIVLPVKATFAAVVLYYLFYSHWLDVPTREAALEFLQGFFIFYIFFNAFAAVLLVLKRFPHKLVPWVVFTVGLLDGVLLAGLTVETGGFGSNFFWVFPGLIVLNALSIPLAAPQIVLNLSLCAFYLAAGVLNISLGEELSMGPLPAHQNWLITKDDISDLKSFAGQLRQTNALSRYLSGQLSTLTWDLLTNYNGVTNSRLQQYVADDVNRIIQHEPIYSPERFADKALSLATSNLLTQSQTRTNDFVRLNRMLLCDAFPREIAHPRRPAFMEDAQTPVNELPTAEDAEFFVLKLIILLLLTGSCYGLQLLSFRQRLSDEEARKSAARNDELRAAGRLAAEIAHQLKNPLGIINNAAFSLRRGLKDVKGDYSLQLEIIREEIERSDRIITQLMGYAQLSEGRVEKLVLTEELDRAAGEVFPPGTTYEIKLHRHYGPDLPGLLMQRNHFSVVLVNLLQNAREALSGRGNIHIYARTQDEDAVEIAIVDDGPGIAADKVDKVFEAYFTSKEKGTGLGLAIVKHNVELYGGTIWVESELGKGARFVISFPAKTLIKAV